MRCSYRRPYTPEPCVRQSVRRHAVRHGQNRCPCHGKHPLGHPARLHHAAPSGHGCGPDCLPARTSSSPSGSHPGDLYRPVRFGPFPCLPDADIRPMRSYAPVPHPQSPRRTIKPVQVSSQPLHPPPVPDQRSDRRSGRTPDVLSRLYPSRPDQSPDQDPAQSGSAMGAVLPVFSDPWRLQPSGQNPAGRTQAG